MNLAHQISSFETPLLLAPMAGVSDIAFRTLCLEQGADLTYTEMVSAKGLSYASEKTRKLLQLASNETRVAVQLFGHEPDTMAAQAAWIEKTLGNSLFCIDVNMGCPARKIVTKGDGSALMKDRELASEIVSSIVSAVEHPVTVKIRRGWEEGSETAPEFACALADAGASMITVHGRYAMQLYKGRANWDVIKRVKESISVPVIGNGDVKSAQDALMLKQTSGCDGIMIARAAEGNPWIFSQVRSALEGKDVPDAPSINERLSMARRHAHLLSKRDGRNLVRMRKHAMWYMAGLPGAAAARGKINSCCKLEDFYQVFDELEVEASRHAS